jgi:hypothetical protein
MEKAIQIQGKKNIRCPSQRLTYETVLILPAAFDTEKLRSKLVP